MSNMPICCVNNQMLHGFREAHVAAKMQEYHAKMKEVFEEGLKGMDIDAMKKQVLEKVTKEPWKTNVEVSYEFPLSKLFIERTLFVDDQDGKKACIRNPKEPLECWIQKPSQMSEKPITYVYRFYLGDSYYDEPNTRPIWEEYMYTGDPETQALRKRLQEAFPDAELHPMIYGSGCLSEPRFRIAIIHNLPSHIPGSEAATKPPRTGPGGYVQWEQNPKSRF